jgi:hypothetical protein
MVSGACPGELKEGGNETKCKLKDESSKFSTEQALLCYYPKENPRAMAGRSDTGEKRRGRKDSLRNFGRRFKDERNKEYQFNNRGVPA